MLPTPFDMACFDGQETVRLQAPGALVSVDVSGALRTRARTQEARPSGGIVLATDVYWHLPANAVVEQPQLGTRIIDTPGTVWTVLRVDRETLGSRWQCLSRNLSLALGLEHVINIERATWSKDTAGAPVATWSLLRAGMKARVQPIAAAHEVRQGQRLERVSHEIHLAEALALDENHRIVQGDVVYNVRGYAAPDRIDAPLIIHAERAPWPWS